MEKRKRIEHNTQKACGKYGRFSGDMRKKEIKR